MKYRFCVITRVSRENLCDVPVYQNRHDPCRLYVDSGYFPPDEHDWRMLGMAQMPLFYPGEIFIVDEGEVEVPWQRKPWKWSCDYELFDDLESATKRSFEIFAEFFDSLT